MGKISHTPRIISNPFGRRIISNNSIEDFNYLLYKNVNNIILFEDGTEELYEKDALILPRHYYIFINSSNGEQRFKPYEYDNYRISVDVVNDIIININSIG